MGQSNRIIKQTNENKQLIKITQYQPNGKTIEYIADYNPQTGRLTKSTHFQHNSKTIDFIIEYNKDERATKTHHSNTNYVKNEQKK
ncbi:DUF2963 domain-containing protein [Candidatus Phytoplasma solani]|uniref:DUF2963 domain-containing protein n=1 Tax=Candidatus Phytoplasma solani TaxID=69896 RepID=UPI0032DBB363